MDFNLLREAFIALKKKRLGRGYIELPEGMSKRAKVRIRKKIKRSPTKYMVRPVPSLLKRKGVRSEQRIG